MLHIYRRVKDRASAFSGIWKLFSLNNRAATDLKKFTSKQIIKAIQENNSESRKEWMLNIFGYTGSQNKNNKEFQFWKQDYHPIELDTAEKFKERLDYLHNNPVEAGIVWE